MQPELFLSTTRLQAEVLRAARPKTRGRAGSLLRLGTCGANLPRQFVLNVLGVEGTLTQKGGLDRKSKMPAELISALVRAQCSRKALDRLSDTGRIR
jgi:hypothetical protein